jgi:hypothetical protein
VHNLVYTDYFNKKPAKKQSFLKKSRQKTAKKNSQHLQADRFQKKLNFLAHFSKKRLTLLPPKQFYGLLKKVL